MFCTFINKISTSTLDLLSTEEIFLFLLKATSVSGAPEKVPLPVFDRHDFLFC
ncbi:hypothetical protein Plhal304r1_c021g0075861 [Plasmopara halstedii]